MADTYAKGGLIPGQGEKVGYDPEIDGGLITPEAARKWVEETGALDRLNESDGSRAVSDDEFHAALSRAKANWAETERRLASQ